MIKTPRPNYDEVAKETGPYTQNALQGIWAALERLDRSVDATQNQLGVKTVRLTPSASVNNQSLGMPFKPVVVVSFEGSSSVNLTGFLAPPTGRSQVIVGHVNGSGTITVKNSATSETANQIVTNTGADVTKGTGTGFVLVYANSKFRQVA